MIAFGLFGLLLLAAVSSMQHALIKPVVDWMYPPAPAPDTWTDAAEAEPPLQPARDRAKASKRAKRPRHGEHVPNADWWAKLDRKRRIAAAMAAHAQTPTGTPRKLP